MLQTSKGNPPMLSMSKLFNNSQAGLQGPSCRKLYRYLQAALLHIPQSCSLSCDPKLHLQVIQSTSYMAVYESLNTN